MSPGAGGWAWSWDVTSAETRLERMRRKVEPERGLHDMPEGQQQCRRV